MTTILLGKECSPFLDTGDSVLQRAAVRLVWAETSDAYVGLAREHEPDLVILDPQVPGFDAYACAREILAARAGQVKILVIGNTAEQERAEAAGVSGLLTRPVTQARLIDAIRKYNPLVERESDRVEVAVKVAFVRGGADGLAYTRDLAPDGAFLLTHEPFEPGERVTLSFQIPSPGGREIRVEAEVLRAERGSGSGGVAVRFLGLAAADHVEIGRFLRSRGRGVA